MEALRVARMRMGSPREIMGGHRGISDLTVITTGIATTAGEQEPYHGTRSVSLTKRRTARGLTHFALAWDTVLARS